MKFTEQNSPIRSAGVFNSEDLIDVEQLDLLRSENWHKYEESRMEVANMQALIQVSPGGHAVWKIPHLERQITFLAKVLKNTMAIDEEKSKLKKGEQSGGDSHEVKVSAPSKDGMVDSGTDVVQKLEALQSSVDEMRKEMVEIWKYIKRDNAQVTRDKNFKADTTVVTEDTVDKGAGPMAYRSKEVGTEVRRTYSCSVSSAASGDSIFTETISPDAGSWEKRAEELNSTSGLHVKDDFKKRVKESVKQAATEFKMKVKSSLDSSTASSCSDDSGNENLQDLKSPVKEVSKGNVKEVLEISPKMIKPKLVPRPKENETVKPNVAPRQSENETVKPKFTTRPPEIETVKSQPKTVDETKTTCDRDEEMVKAILDPLFDTAQELDKSLVESVVSMLESMSDSVDWTPFVKSLVSRSIENSASAKRGAEEICRRLASSERLYSRIKSLLIARCHIEFLSCLEKIQDKNRGQNDVPVRSWMGLIWFLARLSSNLRIDVIGTGAVELMQNIISIYEPLSKMKGCLNTALKVLQFLEPHIVSRKANKFVEPLKKLIAEVKRRAKSFDVLMPEEKNLAKTLEKLVQDLVTKIA